MMNTPNAIIGNATAEEARQLEAEARHAPASDSEVMALLLRQNIQKLTVSDEDAVRIAKAGYYPDWDGSVKWLIGEKVYHGGKLYRRRTESNPPEIWEPGAQGSESLWEYIPEHFEGTIYDPIPYEGNQELEKGKFYIENSIRYECTRNTGTPIHNKLSELVGIYVKIS